MEHHGPNRAKTIDGVWRSRSSDSFFRDHLGCGFGSQPVRAISNTGIPVSYTHLVKKADEQQEKDWLVLDLEKPVTYNGMQINQLDMSGLREMTGRDLNVIYDLYASQGGDRVIMQESTLLFAQVVASRVCGYPVEAVQELKAKDSVCLLYTSRCV